MLPSPRHALALGALALLLTAASAAQATPHVQLLEAKVTLDAMTPGGYCPACHSLSGLVEVANLAYAKHVAVWYTTGNGEWKAVPASYEGPTRRGYEAWSYGVSLGYLPDPQIQLAVQYQVNGQEYWDNNGGQDFVITPATPMFWDVPVRVTSAHIGTGLGCYGLCRDLTVKVRVKNIAYVKQVTLWFSVNGGEWRPWRGRFEHMNGHDFETWKVYIPYLGTGTPNVQFAVRYDAGGGTWWDNHFGQDYTL